MKYNVKTFRDAGLESKWSKLKNSCPCIMVRNPNSKYRHKKEIWWIVDKYMFKMMEEQGIIEGFENFTELGDIFSINK